MRKVIGINRNFLNWINLLCEIVLNHILFKESKSYYIYFFVLREWKEKVEMEDHEQDDTITYKKLDKFRFRRDLSGPGLSGNEIITLPHMFILVCLVHLLVSLELACQSATHF